MAILGISTNTRLLGLAIISEGQLVAYAIHLHKAPWSARKADTIITSLEPCVRRYCITSVVLSTPHAYYHTPAIKTLYRRIATFFKAHNLPLYTKASATLTELCTTEQAKTKKEVMNVLSHTFPELSYYYRKELRNRNKYYEKLFEAVGIALLAEKG